MRPFLRSLFAIVMALWLALPSVGGEGGENGGGGGVWVLPRAGGITNTTGTTAVSGPIRATISVPDLSRDTTLTVASELGQVVATFIDQVSGSPTSLPVSGKNVIVPASVLQGMLQAGLSDARIFVVDGSQRGYQIMVRIDAANRSATLSVY